MSAQCRAAPASAPRGGASARRPPAVSRLRAGARSRRPSRLQRSRVRPTYLGSAARVVPAGTFHELAAPGLIGRVLVVYRARQDEIVFRARAALAAVDDVMELDSLARAADPAVFGRPLAPALVALPHGALDPTRNRHIGRRARRRLLGRPRPFGQPFPL